MGSDIRSSCLEAIILVDWRLLSNLSKHIRSVAWTYIFVSDQPVVSSSIPKGCWQPSVRVLANSSVLTLSVRQNYWFQWAHISASQYSPRTQPGPWDMTKFAHVHPRSGRFFLHEKVQPVAEPKAIWNEHKSYHRVEFDGILSRLDQATSSRWGPWDPPTRQSETLYNMITCTTSDLHAFKVFDIFHNSYDLWWVSLLLIWCCEVPAKTRALQYLTLIC